MLIAEEWPTFLYDELAGWSMKDVRNGLFRGHVLARVGSTRILNLFSTRQHPWPLHQVALRIFRNKSAVSRDEIGGWFDPQAKCKGPKDFLTKNTDIKKVTPQMIAYAALQV